MRKSNILIGVTLIFLLSMSFSITQAQRSKSIFKNIVLTFRPLTAAQEKNIAKALALTSEQRVQMKEFSKNYRKDARILLDKYNSAHNDVVKLIKQKTPNKSVVSKKLKVFHRTHQQIVNKEVEYWRKFTSILTLEQNKKFWNLFEMSRVRV